MKEKHKLTQRILSLIMVFAMVLGMVMEPIQIRAAEPKARVESGEGGKTATANIMPKKHTVFIATVIAADNGMSISDASIILKDSANTNTYTVRYDEQTQNYQATCPAGEYIVTCEEKRGFTMTDATSQNVTVREDGTVDTKAEFVMRLNDISIATGNVTKLKVNKIAKWNVEKNFTFTDETITWESSKKSVASVDNA